MRTLEKLTIRNFKSIREQALALGRLNIFIGGNGSGKSNLIETFRFLHEIVNQRLAAYTLRKGGADNLLHFGRKTSPEMGFSLEFGKGGVATGYHVRLRGTDEDEFFVAQEMVSFRESDGHEVYDHFLVTSGRESRFRDDLQLSQVPARQIQHDLDSYRVYHFHDTSDTAAVKGSREVEDNRFLRSQAENLAPFLYWLQEKAPSYLSSIEDTIRQIAPFFAKFQLAPSRLNESRIRLEWQEKGSDAYFSANAFSDGTLRFICLATLLLQPELPAVILLDEPELGLHPAAITLLAELLSSAATRTQVLVATQSVTLVNQFEPEDVWAVDRDGGQSIFRHLASADMSAWLDDYALGELLGEERPWGSPLSKRALILVEGQTEERFIKDVLAPAFWPNLFLIPTLLVTKRVKDGPNFKGGVTSFERFKGDLERLIRNPGVALVTTLLDYYGLPADFPGMADRPPGSPEKRVRHVEKAIWAHFGEPRDLIPFLALHELEAWLFSSVQVLPHVLNQPDLESQLAAVRNAYATPEDINEGAETAPSKRILRLVPKYRKPLHGTTALARIGLETIRAECRHFDGWVRQLEAFASS